MINELLQQPGSFSFTLRPGTPVAIRQAVPYVVADIPFGHVAVTAQRLPTESLTRADILSVAVYAGRINSRANQMHTFAGNGLAVWLGDAEDKSNIVSAYGGGVAHTFTAAATQILTTSGLGNGITLGSTAAATGTTTTTDFAQVSPIDLLNQYATNTGNFWRINPDGTFDLGAATSLFQSPPTVVILRNDGGRDLSINGLIASSLEVDEDFDDYATFTVVTGNGANGLAAVATPPQDFSGGSDAALGIGISSDMTTVGACNAAGASYLNLHKTTRRKVTCSVVCKDIHTFCEPGDQIYIYDPETDLIDRSHQVPYRGRVLFPVSAQLLGYTWPIVQGMGVYSIQTQDGSNTVTDLSDWIAWETGTVQFEVGAPRRPAAKRVPNTWGRN